VASFPAARLVVAIVSLLDPARTVMDSFADAVSAGDPLSFADTAKVEVPLAVGVPEITPALESARPAGSFPEASDHV
jgi:hypothetical protein